MASISGSCHCKSTTYTLTLPPGALPLDGTYDHRTALSQSIGFQCTLYAPIPKAHLTLHKSPSAQLTTYTNSVGKLDFCAKCGTTLFLHDDNDDDEKTKLLVSTIDIAACGKTSLRELVVPRQHIYLNETFRGGVSRFMNDGLLRFQHSPEGELWDRDTQEETETEQDVTKPLEGACHCRGVGFSILRPDETYPQDPILKEWVKPGKRYCASYCFCHSCRVVSGAPFWAWAFVPRKQIVFGAQETMQTYESFKDDTRNVTRRFCSRCGCHLFFTGSSPGGRMWDVAVATLDQRAYERGEWFSWRFDAAVGDAEVDDYIDSWKEGRMSFENFGREFCSEMVEEVVGGLRQNL